MAAVLFVRHVSKSGRTCRQVLSAARCCSCSSLELGLAGWASAPASAPVSMLTASAAPVHTGRAEKDLSCKNQGQSQDLEVPGLAQHHDASAGRSPGCSEEPTSTNKLSTQSSSSGLRLTRIWAAGLR